MSNVAITNPAKRKAISSRIFDSSVTLENLNLETEVRAAALLDAHPHFCCRNHQIKFRRVNNRLRLSGSLPSYYLKQMAQEAVRGLKGIDQVENRIVVK